MGSRHVQLWPSVIRELKWACSLIMLASRGLSASWDMSVMAIDASSWGLGAVQRDLPIFDIAAMGRQNERWRFSPEHESSLNPRDSALAAALRGGATQSPDSCDIPAASFSEISPKVWGEGWHLVSSHPWSRSETGRA